MVSEIANCALMLYLKKRNAVYYGKLLEVRKNIEGWLSYVPTTFPNYTRHTINHSDEIVFQLSKLLFEDGDYTKPVVRLSSIEIYILIVASYLHDAGMVVSEAEKLKILASDDWKQFISSGNPGANRWQNISEFRKGSIPENELQRNFLADVQTRFLIAEYIRRNHHTRVADVIAQHEFGLGNFSFGDPILKETISNVCISHGLNRFELLDPEKYPDRRDIRNETANVRFIALLLRIGDLLDMSSDRACPLLLNIACSIPSDSLAHWTKYQQFTHKLTAPDKIEIHALCENQDEHRFLIDWCQWLVDEVKEAGNIMSNALRHNEWRQPEISLEGPAKTIKIEPKENANYIPSNWKFKLDETVIFERLIKDVYDHPLTFVRELIQNALDASRCQLYLELKEKGLKQPDFSTEAPAEIRNKYPIRLSLSTKMLENELSGSSEEYHVVTIEDNGIGMDKNIIENFLLQIGNSYYTTSEFRRSFKFTPSSRFGLGFLSVFAMSNKVIVETFKPSSKSGDGQIRVTLTGPRNYLLVEKGSRKIQGTRIEVLMRKRLDIEKLRSAISYWCKKIEFPLFLNFLGEEKRIRTTKFEDLEKQVIISREVKKVIKIKAYPIEAYGIEGEVYIPSIIENGVERWDRGEWILKEHRVLFPSARPIKMPDRTICINGITIYSSGGFLLDRYKLPYAYLVDIRKNVPNISLTRQLPIFGFTEDLIFDLVPETKRCIENALLAHLKESKLSKSKDGWRYKNDLAHDYGSLTFWSSVPGTIKVHVENKPILVSLGEICRKPIIRIIAESPRVYNVSQVKRISNTKTKNEDIMRWVINLYDLYRFDQKFIEKIFNNRYLSSIERLPESELAMDWEKKSEREIMQEELKIGKFNFTNDDLISISIYSLKVNLFNPKNQVTKWLLALKEACKKGKFGLSPEEFSNTLKIINDAIVYSASDRIWRDGLVCLNGWLDHPFSEEFPPPLKNFQKQLFLRVKDKYV